MAEPGLATDDSDSPVKRYSARAIVVAGARARQVSRVGSGVGAHGGGRKEPTWSHSCLFKQNRVQDTAVVFNQRSQSLGFWRLLVRSQVDVVSN